MPLEETPKPTFEQLREVRRARIGAASPVLLEVRRRLRETLPDYIDHLNEEGGGDGKRSGLIQLKAERIRFAPAFFDDNCINSILLSISSQSKSLAGRILGHDRGLVVFSIDDDFEIDEQIVRSIDRAEAAATVLSAFHNGCENAAGITVWKTMKYTGAAMIPPEISNGYAGAMAMFEVEQTPFANGLAYP